MVNGHATFPHGFSRAVSAFGYLILDAWRFLQTAVRSRVALSAEILFLRKQLAFYQEREVKPRRLTDSARASLLLRGESRARVGVGPILAVFL